MWNQQCKARGDRRRHGIAASELAILCPLIGVLIVGMLEMSRGTMVKVTLCNAARKGCQTGVMQAKGNTDITNDVTNILRDAGFDSSKFNPPTIGSITITVTDPTGNSVPDALSRGCAAAGRRRGSRSRWRRPRGSAPRPA